MSHAGIVKTAEPIAKFFSPSGIPTSPVLPRRRSLENLNGVLPQGALNKGGVGKIAQIALLLLLLLFAVTHAPFHVSSAEAYSWPSARDRRDREVN